MIDALTPFGQLECTPVTRIAGFDFEQQGVELWMKRDDTIHPFISGNKWRKLKYTIQEAQQRGTTRLVTFGGTWSNHLLATACAGAQFGLSTLGFVRGDEAVTNPVLRICQLFGMELRYVERNAYRDKRGLFNALERESGKDEHHNFFVDEGGFGRGALKGCAEIVHELRAQLPGATHLFTACGTGATLAGLSEGCRQLPDFQLQAHGVPVLKDSAYLRDQILQLSPEADFDWHTEYHFGGYAKTQPALLEFVKKFCATTGILIEPVYTGKVCYAVTDLMRAGYFPAGSQIVVLHTGGLTGLLGLYEKFQFSSEHSS